MKILVTGGCGYVGSVLVKDLIDKDFEVIIVDTQWFGNYLAPHKNLKIIKSSFNKIDETYLYGVDSVIHLANIANDPSVDLNPVLSWEVNALATTELLELCKRSNIKQFVYASSGSVYGVKDELNVTEDLDLVPISTYNKTKMVTERICLSYSDDFIVQCVRPATVCGVSPRMRFDVVVNMFVQQALMKKKITILGGDQVRPNIHIKDMSNVYLHFLENKIDSGCFNAGFENLTVKEIAEKVSKIIECDLEIQESNDPRSYRQDSSKLVKTGFKKMHSVDDAILEIKSSFDENKIKDNPRWYTVSWMKHLIANGELNGS